MTQCPFPNFSELQLRVDGVNATPRRRDAVDVAVRASTRLVREPRRVATLFHTGGRGRLERVQRHQQDRTRAASVLRDASPGEEAVARFVLNFELFRTASRRVETAVASMAWRWTREHPEHAVDATTIAGHPPPDPHGVQSAISVPVHLET